MVRDFLSENFQEELHGGTLFLIPPETYHRFQLENENSYARLVISFPDIPGLEGLIKPLMSKINIIKEITPSVSALLSKMESILNADGEAEVKTYLYGAFLMLISELSLCPPKAVTPTFAEKNGVVQSCIKYIEENLANPIPVGALAERMNVSQATLFKSFKNQLGISVHKNISVKRLLLAHKLIRSGEKPTKIYSAALAIIPHFTRAIPKCSDIRRRQTAK